jgi:hypothetical protein
MPEAQLYNFCLAPAQPTEQIVRQIKTHLDFSGGTNSTSTRAPLSTSLTITPKSTTSTLMVQIAAAIKVNNTASNNQLGAVAYPGFDNGSGWNNAPYSGATIYQNYASNGSHEVRTGANFIGLLDQAKRNASGNWVVALLGEAMSGTLSSINATGVNIVCTEFDVAA